MNSTPKAENADANAAGIPDRLPFAMLVIVAIAALYGVQGNGQEVALHGHSAILWMVQRWDGSGGDLSHAWLIPLVSVFCLWRRRGKLRAAVGQPAWLGVAAVASCLLLHWMGLRSQLTRLSLFSMIGLLWSIPFALYGWSFARWLIFPCAYLLFCVPFSFLSAITVPLRMIATSTSAALLNGVGIGATAVGTAIYSLEPGRFQLDVADACSGLRSLLALTALTAAYANLTQKGLVRQWVLFLCAIPLAVVGNVGRILTIGIVAYASGSELAAKIYHDYSAFIVFPLAILLMVGIGNLLSANVKECVQRWARHEKKST